MDAAPAAGDGGMRAWHAAGAPPLPCSVQSSHLAPPCVRPPPPPKKKLTSLTSPYASHPTSTLARPQSIAATPPTGALCWQPWA